MNIYINIIEKVKRIQIAYQCINNRRQKSEKQILKESTVKFKNISIM